MKHSSWCPHCGICIMRKEVKFEKNYGIMWCDFCKHEIKVPKRMIFRARYK